MRRLLLSLALLALVAVPSIALATNAAASILVGKDEVIDGNFLRAGQLIQIDGTVEGDVMVAGQTVIVNGTVTGDVIVAAQTIRIRGTVAGNVRLAGNTVELDGAVGKNATIFANTLETSDRSTIGWSLLGFAASVSHQGVVSGNLRTYSSTAIVRGTVNGNAELTVGDEAGSLLVTTSAVVGKNLTYHANQEATIQNGATITGSVERFPGPVMNTSWKHMVAKVGAFAQMMSLVGVLVVGLVLVAIAPKTSMRVLEQMQKRPWKSMGWGLMSFILIPIVAVILLVTIIGIPLAVILFLLYGIGLFLTRVFAGYFLGHWILKSIAPKATPAPVWPMLLGIVVFSILCWVPIIGWIIGLLGMLWALGGMLMAKRELFLREERA